MIKEMVEYDEYLTQVKNGRKQKIEKLNGPTTIRKKLNPILYETPFVNFNQKPLHIPNFFDRESKKPKANVTKLYN